MNKVNAKSFISKLLYLSVCFAFIACYSLSINRTDSSKTAKDRWSDVKENFIVYPDSLTPGAPCTVLYIPSKGYSADFVTSKSNAVQGAALPPSAEKNVIIGLKKTPHEGGVSQRKAILYNAQGKKLAAAQFFYIELEDGHSAEAAMLTPPSTTSPGSFQIKIEYLGSVQKELSLTVEPRDFVSEVIPLNPVNTGIRTEPDPQKTKESQMLWNILSRTDGQLTSMAVFITPVPAQTRRSSFFGDRRVYKYSNGKSDTSVHAGIDYAVPKGTPVLAAADGKVVLARPRIVTGNSIVLEHLPGVYSLYYHLDSIAVEEGTDIKAGVKIGLSGSTGLSTGPHLHWEIRVSGENTDPDAMVARPLLDKPAIIKKIFNSKG